MASSADLPPGFFKSQLLRLEELLQEKDRKLNKIQGIANTSQGELAELKDKNTALEKRVSAAPILSFKILLIKPVRSPNYRSNIRTRFNA
jgi:hypothetical protein